MSFNTVIRCIMMYNTMMSIEFVLNINSEIGDIPLLKCNFDSSCTVINTRTAMFSERNYNQALRYS